MAEQLHCMHCCAECEALHSAALETALWNEAIALLSGSLIYSSGFHRNTFLILQDMKTFSQLSSSSFGTAV